VQQKKILVYGYGNPGRQDDGLGIALVEEIEKWANQNKFDWLETDSNYQLNIEDATAINNKDFVIFADASMEEDIEDCLFSILQPSEKTSFTMHAVSPAYILFLCNRLFNKNPNTYLLHIKGYEWEFMKGFTPKAQENLSKALDLVKERILHLYKQS
jgi:hydrogenase maturation protease